MQYNEKRIKAGIIAFMVAAILCLHYFTLPQEAYLHAVYRTLFYLPLILGGLWFGMRGSLLVCGTVLVLFLTVLCFVPDLPIHNCRYFYD